MFTGIVRAVGHVANVEPRGGDVRLHVELGALSDARFELGDSVCVNGACLTVIEQSGSTLGFDVSLESLSATTIGSFEAGTRVNLEPATTPSTALGGHIVSGHVDTVATLVSRHDDARSIRMLFEVPDGFERYIASKGSVCIDGVSLTVNGVDDNRFDVNIVPHTASVTIMGTYEAGASVNLEVDVIARYVERLLAVERKS